jgi:hypothetical protein
MGKVFLDVTMSPDGFTAGSNDDDFGSRIEPKFYTLTTQHFRFA